MPICALYVYQMVSFFVCFPTVTVVKVLMFPCFHVLMSAADFGANVWCCWLWWPQVARYFGFAQQVAVELGPLLPQEVRHSMAFVSVLVSMAIDKNEVQCVGMWVCATAPPLVLYCTSISFYGHSQMLLLRVHIEPGQLQNTSATVSHSCHVHVQSTQGHELGVDPHMLLAR